MKHTIAPGVAYQMVAGEALLVDLSKGVAIGLNDTGSLIWSLLETRDLDAVVDAVAERFDIDETTARDDVDSFLSDLSKRGLLVEQG